MQGSSQTLTPRTRKARALFSPGRIYATPGALAALDAAQGDGLALLARHVHGDWGDLAPEDAAANDEALVAGGRLFSAYHLTTGVKVWIITEADRRASTLLLPEEY